MGIIEFFSRSSLLCTILVLILLHLDEAQGPGGVEEEEEEVKNAI